jgi:hypothetical protein
MTSYRSERDELDRSRDRTIEEWTSIDFPLIPLTPRGKAPLRKGWQAAATTDKNLLRKVLLCPSRPNIGVVCPEGYFVVDVDGPEGDRLVRSLGLPPTPKTRTADGYHLTLKGRARTRTGIRPEVDIRGPGSYVVAAGSIHPSGVPYEFEAAPSEVPVAYAPPQLLAIVNERPRARARNASDEAVIRPGTRNSTLTRIAGRLVAAGAYPDAIRAALHAENRARCRPPLSKREVDKIADSAAGWPRAGWWKTDPLRFAADPALTRAESHLLVVLTQISDHDGKSRWSQGTLTSLTRYTPSTIGPALAGLERAGLVEVSRRANCTNRVRLLTPSSPPPPSPLGCSATTVGGTAARRGGGSR